MTRFRLWLTDVLAGVGTWFYDLASTVDPGPLGEVCPDCGVPTTVPLDKPCPECAIRAEEQRRDDAIYRSGREDGYVEGCRDMEARFQ